MDVLFTNITPGAIIAYKLKSSDWPLNPNKVWRGRVMHYDSNAMLVTMLEPGYDGLTEIVFVEQVVGIDLTKE